jgi:hypothetical protein
LDAIPRNQRIAAEWEATIAHSVRRSAEAAVVSLARLAYFVDVDRSEVTECLGEAGLLRSWGHSLSGDVALVTNDRVDQL